MEYLYTELIKNPNMKNMFLRILQLMLHTNNLYYFLHCRNFPASFTGHHGSVKYILEVSLDRSWKMDHTEKKEITFVPRLSDINLMVRAGEKILYVLFLHKLI